MNLKLNMVIGKHVQLNTKIVTALSNMQTLKMI